MDPAARSALAAVLDRQRRRASELVDGLEADAATMPRLEPVDWRGPASDAARRADAETHRAVERAARDGRELEGALRRARAAVDG